MASLFSLFGELGIKVDRSWADAQKKIRSMAALANQKAREMSAATRASAKVTAQAARQQAAQLRANAANVARQVRNEEGWLARKERSEAAQARANSASTARQVREQARVAMAHARGLAKSERRTAQAAAQQVRITARSAAQQVRAQMRADERYAAWRVRRDARARARGFGASTGGGGGGGFGGRGAVGGVTGAVGGFRAKANFASRAFTGMAAFTAGAGLVKLADTYSTLHSRLRLVATSEADVNAQFERAQVVAKNTRSELKPTIEGFVKIAQSVEGLKLGLSNDEIWNRLERVQKTIKISGANTVESTQGFRQLVQGLGSNTLQGEELKSVLESIPAVADQIAKHMGVNRGQLRKLAADGKISAKTVLDAFGPKFGADIDKRFAVIKPTMGDAFVDFKNKMTVAFGKFAQDTNLAENLADALTYLGKALILVMAVLKPIIGAIKSFVDGLKNGEVWAIALAAAFGLMLLPKLISFIGLLAAIPRKLAVMMMGNVLVWLMDLASGFGKAAAAARGLAAATLGTGGAGGAGGAGAKGGAKGGGGGMAGGLLGALGPIGLAVGSAMVLNELSGGSLDKSMFGLGFLDRVNGGAGAGAGGGAAVNQTNTININGVKDGDQAVGAIEGALRESAERQYRHAMASVGGTGS